MANQIITRVQVEGNDVVSFLNGTNYVRSMSQILPQNPTYISYRYDSITISQVAGEAFSFTVYTVDQVGGISFLPLTFQDPADIVQARTIEIYRLLVTSIFKGCCECGNTEPECSIQYKYDEDPTVLGTFAYDGTTISFNYTTGNNQDFTGFFPIIQDGSWAFLFSKTDPTIYAVIQLSNFVDQTTYAQFDVVELNAQGTPFVPQTEFCIDFTSVGGSLVQDWQDTLNISSLLTQSNIVDGGGFTFDWTNVSKYNVISFDTQTYTSDDGSGTGSVVVDPGAVTLSATGYIDIITPGYPSASTGWVLALDASGHVEYVEAGTGTISSIELLMPPAFTVSDPNPLITDGTFTVTVDGTEDQYINGLGELATFPVYTVENGLHAFGGVPGEAPPDPFLFHLGGLLVEDTTITVTNGAAQYAFGVAGLAAQDTQIPFGVSNLGQAGVATFQDYAIGSRVNPSVEIVGDNDTFKPLLDLTLEGPLPNPGDPGIWENRNSFLSLRHTGDTGVGARIAMDYTFRNTSVSPSPDLYLWPALKIIVEATNVNENEETSNVSFRMFEGGSQQDKLLLEGKGQLTLNEYGGPTFTDGTTNINSSLTYLLGTDNTGKVWKKLAAGGGTVQSVGAAGLLTTTATNPFTVSGTVTTNMATNRLVGRYSPGSGIMQEIVIGSGLTLTGDTLTAEGGTGFDVEVNGTLIIPPATVLNLKSGTDIDVIHEGGGTVRFDYVGTAAGYNSDQGVYKDTSLATDTFMLGAPLGSEGGIAFQVDRYIYTDDFKLSLRGNPTDDWQTTDGSILDIIFDASTSGQTSAGIKIDASAGPGKTAGIAINQGTGIAILVDGVGDGIILTSDGSPISTYLQTLTGLNSVQESYRMTRQTKLLDPAISNGFGTGMTFVLFDGNGVVPQTQGAINLYYSDVTPGTQAADMQFSVNLPGLGTNTPSLTLKGTNQPGQVQFNEYGTGAITGTPAYSLGVDSSGNVIEIVGSGPAPGLQDVITTDPVLTANNTITGTSFDLKFDQFANFEANAVSTVKAYTVNGINIASLEINTVGSPFVEIFSTQSGGGFTGITLRDTRMEIKTPSYATKAVGDVLTLVDPLTGEAEWDTPTGSTYTVNNGLSPDPLDPNNFQLGGLLVGDTTIDGDGNTYSLAFDGMYIIGGTASFKTSFTVSDGTTSSVLAIQPTIANIGSGVIGSGSASFAEFTDTQSRLGYLTPTQTVQFGADATGLYVKTPDVAAAAATAGQVLTLINATTGESEWADGGGGSGGGAGGRVYYLNGSVVQGTFAGIASMRQMSPVPIAGAGTDFTISSNGYIQSFITNAGDPNKVVIPAGNWNFELWFSATSPGGSPSFYVELSKYDTVGGTFTPIATSAGSPEGITNGTTIDLYFTALSVPQTPLATTDRLAVRVWVNNSGRTITLHTEGVHFSQIITSFPSGILSLNGLTGAVQTFATPGTSGTAPSWTSAGTAHTINIPLASAAGVTAGLISKTEYDAFNGKVGPTRAISTTSPLSGGGNLSADLTLSIADAAADGTTKGAAAFTATDFNSAAGVISIDYTNGQAASSSNKGFLTSADWTRFDSFKTQTIGITVDGSGGVITAGNKGYVRIPYACTITFWSIITTGGGSGASLSFDILRANNAIPTLSIIGAGGTKPNISGSAQLSPNTAPSLWTSVILNANDILAFNVDSGAAVYSWANLQLTISRT